MAATMTMKYFDTLEYVRKAKEIKNPEELAEYQVKKIEEAMENLAQHVHDDIASKELATKADLMLLKSDLKLEINQKIEWLRYDSLKSTIWTGIGVVVSLGGLIMHGFHWI